ncbi:hypothetical protein ACP4OV_031510 [Aristida adscensionis]
MGSMLWPHHQISTNPIEQTAFRTSFAPHKGSSRSYCVTIRSEVNGAASPRAVRKHSKEELIAFFKGIQTAIAESSPTTSRRTRKQSSGPFEEVDKRKQSYEGIGGGDDGTGDISDEQSGKAVNLEDMKVDELRELARARRMRGYSKLKKSELIDRLKGAM